MSMELVRFKEGMDEQFEEAILHFASNRYHCAVTRPWKVMTVHVDPAAWIDLFRVSRHSAMEATADDWPTCDAWSLTWDCLTPLGWVHANQPQRERLVSRLELDSFDSAIAKRATRFDLVTFLQDDLLDCIAKMRKIPDLRLHVLCHEIMHSVSDWTGKPLVVDGVPPSEDIETAATLAAFIRHVGGWDAFRRQYLL